MWDTSKCGTLALERGRKLAGGNLKEQSFSPTVCHILTGEYSETISSFILKRLADFLDC